MPYASIDDNMAEHPKVARLSDGAFRAYITSICFCARNLTDGLVLHSQAAKVSASPKIIRDLVAANCWDDDPLGWRVHDYLEWNKSRVKVMELRAAQKAKADARWDAVGNAKGTAVGNAVSSAGGSARGNAGSNALPAPPLLSRSRSHSPPPAPPAAGARAREAGGGAGLSADVASVTLAIENTLGFSRTVVEKALAELDEGVQAQWIVDACEEAAVNSAKSWRYVEAILDHWRDHGRDCTCRKRGANGASGEHLRTGSARPSGNPGGSRGGLGTPRVDPAFDKFVDE